MTDQESVMVVVYGYGAPSAGASHTHQENGD